MHHEPNDVITLAVLVVAFVTSMDVAVIIGPHVAIIVGSVAGAGLALSLPGPPDLSRWWQPTMFVVTRVIVAFALTSSVAEIVAVATGIGLRPLLVPVAAGIGAVRDYGSVWKWITAALKKVVPAWLANLGKRDGR